MTSDVLPVNVSSVVASVVDAYLTDLLGVVPEIVDGVYLTGSVALGDFHTPWSDIDFVTVLRERPAKRDLRALAGVHERIAADHPTPRLDGWYLTWPDLYALRDPKRTMGLRARGARMHGGRNWVPPALVWHEMAEHGLHVYGPQLTEREIARDPDGVRDWCLETLDTTWTPWWHANARLVSMAGFGSLGSWATASGVLGVARIRYTLDTGKVTSKCGGGEWALEALDPHWRRILEESLRIRNRPDRRSLYRSPFRRRRDALAFIDTVITEAEETVESPEPAP
jgi:hypothetical protein